MSETTTQGETAEVPPISERMEALARDADLGLWACDVAINKGHWNDHARRHLGVPSGTPFSLASLTDHIHPDDRAGAQAAIRQALQEGTAYQGEYRVFSPHDAEVRWTRLSGSVTCDAQGAPLRFDGITVDITQQKRAALLNTCLLSVTQALSEGLAAERIADIALQQGLTLFGSAAGIVLHRPENSEWLRVLGTVNYPPEFVAAWQHCSVTRDLPVPHSLRHGEALFLETRASLLRFSEMRPIVEATAMAAFAAFPLKIKDRTIAAMGFSFTEPRTFTEEERARMLAVASQCAPALERALLLARETQRKDDMERALRCREEFLSIASHELKSPITGLQLQLELLQRRLSKHSPSPLPAPMHAAVATSLRQVQRLTALVDDLLDVTRIQSGHLSYAFEEIAVLDLVTDVANRLDDQLQRSGCTLHVEVEPQLRAVWDRSRIEQVLTNLLGNALKYAPGTPLQVRAEADEAYIVLTVRDSGPGVPDSLQQEIFERFARVEATRRHVAGLGLGLYIVKRIIEGHGGAIWMKDAATGGAEFVMRLPRLAVAALDA